MTVWGEVVNALMDFVQRDHVNGSLQALNDMPVHHWRAFAACVVRGMLMDAGAPPSASRIDRHLRALPPNPLLHRSGAAHRCRCAVRLRRPRQNHLQPPTPPGPHRPRARRLRSGGRRALSALRRAPSGAAARAVPADAPPRGTAWTAAEVAGRRRDHGAGVRVQ